MKKTQGEIFGIAILFVIIIIAVLIYAQIDNLTPKRDVVSFSQSQNKILVDGVLQTIMKVSTTCESERGKNSLEDLFEYCLKDLNSKIRGCENSCQNAVNYINTSLKNLFENKTIGEKLYFLEIDRKIDTQTGLKDINITNSKKIKFRGKDINFTQAQKLGFSKVPSSYTITAKRGIEFRLYILYR